MGLTMKSHVGVKEGIILAGVVPAGRTVRLWNQMGVNFLPTGGTSEILLFDSTL